MKKSIGLRRVAAGLPVRVLLAGFVAIASHAWADDPAPAQQESTPPQSQPESPQSIQLAPTVVTATRVEQPSFDLPLAINSIDKGQIQDMAKPMVNISEQVNRVPGSVVQNRESYAQEQQIILRGFGARSQFGTRGVKLLADGIPASSPDGQGSPGLFDLDSAQRIEVLRGPFSATTMAFSRCGRAIRLPSSSLVPCRFSTASTGEPVGVGRIRAAWLALR
jgi:outer membrane receptor protein involved in Fe transport